MNAFTSKPDMSSWIKKQNINESKAKSGRAGSNTYSARFNYQLTSKNKNQKKSK